MKKSLLIVVLAVLCLVAEAQIQTPAASPAGSVSTTVGLTDIKIEYSRPRAKGRKIFGDAASGALVPNGAIWRTAANNGTKITFADDVTVEGTAVPKGEYQLITWPGATEWTIALLKESIGGNTDAYDKSKEAVSFKVKPTKLTEKVEMFTINIGDVSDDNKSARIELAWENTSVKFSVGVDFDAKVMKSIDTYTKVNPGNYYTAAVYYLENNKDLNKALEWITLADKNNPDQFWILHQKAKIQKALGDKKGAIETANASLKAAKEANNRDYQNMNAELIKSMK